MMKEEFSMQPGTDRAAPVPQSFYSKPRALKNKVFSPNRYGTLAKGAEDR